MIDNIGWNLPSLFSGVSWIYSYGYLAGPQQVPFVPTISQLPSRSSRPCWRLPSLFGRRSVNRCTRRGGCCGGCPSAAAICFGCGRTSEVALGDHAAGLHRECPHANVHLDCGFSDAGGSGGSWFARLCGQVPAAGHPAQAPPAAHCGFDGQVGQVLPAGQVLAHGQFAPAGHGLANGQFAPAGH